MADFHGADLDIWGHSMDGKTPFYYSQKNMVVFEFPVLMYVYTYICMRQIKYHTSRCRGDLVM